MMNYLSNNQFKQPILSSMLSFLYKMLQYLSFVVCHCEIHQLIVPSVKHNVNRYNCYVNCQSNFGCKYAIYSWANLQEMFVFSLLFVI
jgi:hypothetical protein